MCSGVFCDGQPKGECPCLEEDNRKTSWLLSAQVRCEELHHRAVIRSKSLVDIFAPLCKESNPDTSNFDVLDLEDCIEKCVEMVNNKSGWTLLGWVKPSELAVDTVNYEMVMHVVRISPKAVADIQSGMLYRFTFLTLNHIGN